MICTNKDLGLIIIYADYSSKLKYYISEYYEYSIALALDTNYVAFKIFSEDCLTFFNEHFKFIKYEKIGDSGRLLNRYNLYFESDEESILYWCLKYKIIS